MNADLENKKEKQFQFSVIMSVYNVAPFFDEAFDSLVKQTFGFKNIQVILVDDGSSDGSSEICDKYYKLYPDNVVVVHKENGGLSSARNEGMKHVTGKYVNFFDPDDILDADVFSKVYAFIQQHEKEMDVVAIPLIMFGDQNGPHTLNNKFNNGSRVIDLETEWKTVQLSLASAFVNTEIARKYAFNEDLVMATAEDAHELVKIFIRRPKLGIVSDAYYRYRKRGNSNVGSARKNKLWYIPYMNDYPLWAFNYCLQELGYVPKYIQFSVMYDLQWRFRIAELPRDILTESECDIYSGLLTKAIQYIDDDVICGQSYIGVHFKSFLLYKKYNKFPEYMQLGDDTYHLYDKFAAFPISRYAVYVDFVELNTDSVMITGRIPHYCCAEDTVPEFYIEVNGRIIEPEYTSYKKISQSVEEDVCVEYGFKFKFKVENDCNISFYRKTIFGSKRATNIILGKYMPISNAYKNSYFPANGWILTFKAPTLCLTKQPYRFLKYELPFLKELSKSNRHGAKKAVIIRFLYRLAKPIMKNKHIWLIADKANRGDDNGEAFFKYLSKEKKNELTPIFLVGKDTEDYKRIKKYGKVAPYMTKWHRFLYLFADYTISAYSHDEINNPFQDRMDAYRDLCYHCKYIFLQHGVTKDDISKSVHKYHKNIVGFVTAAQVEYDSIVNNYANYGYDPDEVWLTGFPRYDLLYNDEKKSIVIMPTWRRNLFGNYDALNSQWELKDGFEDSQYFNFYTSLLNDERLLSKAEQMGYKLVFVPHPIFFPYLEHFSIDPRVELKGTNSVYREIFAQNELLITDYSSVAFDFAYLRKPVIYAHFDKNHYDEGYFDYDRDGFGEVEHDLEGTVNRIIEYMENDCKLKPQYRERIDNFFAFNDKNNCQRVYEKIMNLEKEEN